MMPFPDGAWHLFNGIRAGMKYGHGIPPYAWERPYKPPTVTVDTGNGTLHTCGTTSYCDRALGFWPRTSATLALAIRETEVVERIEAQREQRLRDRPSAFVSAADCDIGVRDD